MRLLSLAMAIGLFWARVAVAGSDPTKEAIETLFVEMETAVLQGDAQAYMATIDTANPFFLQEQQEWALDLKANTPEYFDLAIGCEADQDSTMAGSDIESSFEAQRAIVPLCMSWRLAGEKEQRVKFPAEFSLREGRWVYSGEHLSQLEFEGFTIRFPKGFEQVAQDIGKAFPVAKAHVDEGFEITNNRHEQIKLYDSRAVLQASVYLSMYKTDLTLSGWNEKGESIKFATWYTTGVPNWTKAFAHEYGHVGTWELGNQAKGLAWWVAEGAAELAAEDFPPNTRNRVHTWAVRMSNENRLAKWEEITDYRTTAVELRGHPYRQGHSMVGFISDTFGRTGRNAWLAALCNGKSLEEATQKALEMSWADLDAKWRASLSGVAIDAKDVNSLEEADINRTLRSMEQSVLQADVEGYMSNVLQTEPEFKTEQMNFAKDLLRKKPDVFKIEISPLAFRSPDVAITDFRMTWHIPGQRAEKERTVMFPAKFVRVNTRWLFAGEDWQTQEADGVIVYFLPSLEEVADDAIEAFEHIRPSVEAGFQLEATPFKDHTQRIRMYKSMRHLQASIYLSYEDSLGGWNEPDESIKLVADPRSSSARLRNVLAHEYGHCATFYLGPKANEMPWWVLEGVAELSAEPFAGGRKSVQSSIRRRARIGDLPEWELLADFHTIKPELYGQVYTQGHHMLGYIQDTFSLTKRNQWLTLMANGKSLDEASLEALGLSWEALDTQWREALPPPEPEEPADQPQEESKDPT